jgi:uncharacterized damage-inducible protein DinB
VAAYASLEIAPFWARMNDTLVQLVDCIPDDKLNWSPKPELWNFKGLLIHICGVRYGWTGAGTDVDADWGAIIREAQTRDGLKRQLEESWDAVGAFVSSAEKLAAAYEDNGTPISGHWIAYHLLEHDIHHRADVFHYLALLGIEHPDVGTP